jgi:hypothetical protein
MKLNQSPMSARKRRRIVVESDSEQEDEIIEKEEDIVEELTSNIDSVDQMEEKIVLYKLLIENFKSYQYFEEVGPFDENFTW